VTRRGGSTYRRRWQGTGYLFTPAGLTTARLLAELTHHSGIGRISITRWLNSLTEAERSKTYFLADGSGPIWTRCIPLPELHWASYPQLRSKVVPVDTRRFGGSVASCARLFSKSSIEVLLTLLTQTKEDGTSPKSSESQAPETTSTLMRPWSERYGFVK
jgi:hypothetical protein